MASQSGPNGLEGLKILLVEDDVLLAMEIEDFLNDNGCEVVGPFARLDKSLEAASRDLDGALLDLNLRGEMSYPLIDRLGDMNVPVIVCSGYIDLPGMGDRLEGIPSLAKPVDHNELAELMRENFIPMKAAAE